MPIRADSAIMCCTRKDDFDCRNHGRLPPYTPIRPCLPVATQGDRTYHMEFLLYFHQLYFQT